MTNHSITNRSITNRSRPVINLRVQYGLQIQYNTIPIVPTGVARSSLGARANSDANHNSTTQQPHLIFSEDRILWFELGKWQYHSKIYLWICLYAGERSHNMKVKKTAYCSTVFNRAEYMAGTDACKEAIWLRLVAVNSWQTQFFTLCQTRTLHATSNAALHEALQPPLRFPAMGRYTLHHTASELDASSLEGLRGSWAYNTGFGILGYHWMRSLVFF